MIFPTEQDLQSLYDAAGDYGKASVESQRVYGRLSRKLGDYQRAVKKPEVRALGAESRRLYQIMDAVRSVVNEKFPGLNLFCPAPHVGWTGELDSYREAVRSQIESYVGHQWAEANEAKIGAVREALASLPLVQPDQLDVNDLVYSTVVNSIFRVAKVSPKRFKIEADCLLRPGELVRLAAVKDKGGGLHEPTGCKRITRFLCDRLMALHQSRKAALRCLSSLS
jgi:hypothetical protein